MFRLLLSVLLLIPLPVLAEDVPYEVTVNEAFDDSTYEEGLTISGGNSDAYICLLYTSPSPRDVEESRMPSSA